ncbi:hypothetical protein PQX77_017278 [Marasmius sp. AFHP31]|nr:hypothetical protein PQX77_017278 [Marasmius sp. AFHP31]
MTVTVGARQPGGRPLHPNGNTDWCVVPFTSIDETTPHFDTNAVIYPCAESDFTLWNFTEGETEVQSAGAPNLCLKSWHTTFGHGDQAFGSYNGATLRVSSCGDIMSGIPITKWIVEGDRFRAANSPNNQCLDLTAGILDTGRNLQTWECTEGNANQVWTF